MPSMPELQGDRAYWIAAAVILAIDIAFLAALARRLPAPRLATLHRMVLLTSSVVWMVLHGAAFWGDAWGTAYGLVLPPAARWVMPFALTLIYTILTYLLLEWVPRLPGPPSAWFAVLGAAVQSIESVWELFGLDMLRVVPALQQVSAAAALGYGFVESVLLWAMILALAPLVRLGLHALLVRLR
jgi:glucan phosphoethanolaminetransferase (alkaline phosphatase superfamily)